MRVRVGVDESIDPSLLVGCPAEAQFMRIPEKPQRQYEIDFWVAAMPPRILRRQWPHLIGVKAVQAPWAGVDTLLNLFPRDAILCDGRGVREIPTAEWAVAVVLAMQKCLPFFLSMQSIGKWAQGAASPTKRCIPAYQDQRSSRSHKRCCRYDATDCGLWIDRGGGRGPAYTFWGEIPTRRAYPAQWRCQCESTRRSTGRSRHRTADRALDVRNKGHDRCAANRENEAGSLAGERCPQSTGRHRSPAASFAGQENPRHPRPDRPRPLPPRSPALESA